jgi:hypothetical protein
MSPTFDGEPPAAARRRRAAEVVRRGLIDRAASSAMAVHAWPPARKDGLFSGSNERLAFIGFATTMALPKKFDGEPPLRRT